VAVLCKADVVAGLESARNDGVSNFEAIVSESGNESGICG